MTRFPAFRVFDDTGKTAGRLTEMTIDELSPGEVVVESAWSSVNYKDALAATGAGRLIRAFPRVTGIDLAGRVASSADPRFSPGDEVVAHGFGIGTDHDGGHAAFARFRADWLLKVPRGLSMFECAAIGVAGYTAALAIDAMELNGLEPGNGPVAITGATGGVSCIAIDILARRGYEVVAISGKADASGYLEALGASSIIDRHTLVMGERPLEAARWAGALDSIGGATLAWLTRTMQPYGVIASFGNAGGAEFSTTVMPFILRGVRLLGINANSPMPLRERIWRRLATDLRPAHLDSIARVVTLEQVPEVIERLLRSESIGRAVVRHGAS